MRRVAPLPKLGLLIVQLPLVKCENPRSSFRMSIVLQLKSYILLFLLVEKDFSSLTHSFECRDDIHPVTSHGERQSALISKLHSRFSTENCHSVHIQNIHATRVHQCDLRALFQGCPVLREARKVAIRLLVSARSTRRRISSILLFFSAMTALRPCI